MARGQPRLHSRWTARDDEILRKWFPIRPTKAVAALLGRSPNTVGVRACVLGLRKAPEYFGSGVKLEARTKKQRRPWTKKEIAKLREWYPTVSAVEIAARLGRGVPSVYRTANQLRIKKDPEFIREVGRVNAARPGHPMHKHAFQKGHTPMNKGVKGWKAGGRSVKTQFKKGQWPVNKDPEFYVLGALRVNVDGYIEMRTSFAPGSSGWTGLHRVLWEDAHGPIPKGHSLTFKDGDRLNVELENLELISFAERMRRNTVHNLPAPLKSAIQLLGQLKRRINEQDRRLADSPVRNAHGAAGSRKADGSRSRQGNRAGGGRDRAIGQG